jgi:hypothetical protein
VVREIKNGDVLVKEKVLRGMVGRRRNVECATALNVIMLIQFFIVHCHSIPLPHNIHDFVFSSGLDRAMLCQMSVWSVKNQNIEGQSLDMT